MQSDDLFRRAFEAAAVHLTAWAEVHRDVAAIDHERAQDFFRLSVAPNAHNACAVELMLHRPTQTYDVQIGEHMWEGLPAPNLESLVPMLDAIVAGDVIVRRYSGAVSGALLKVETVVMPHAHAPLTFSWLTDVGQMLPLADAIAQDHHAVSYRRSGG